MFSISLVIFYKIITTFLVILLGYLVYSLNIIPSSFINKLGKFAIDVATPCLIIVKMPYSINRDLLSTSWYLPLLGAFLLFVSDLTGFFASKFCVNFFQRNTTRFLIAFPNWMFLSLAVCQPIFPTESYRVILLFNIGITIYLWTGGVSAFRSGSPLQVLKQVLISPQLLTTFIAASLVLLFPKLSTLETLPASELTTLPFYWSLTSSILEAAGMVGATAIPLSMLLIGVKLADAKTDKHLSRDNFPLYLSLVFRLVISPFIITLILLFLNHTILTLSSEEFLISVIIFSMPIAVASMLITEIYGGDSALAARGVFWSTLISIVSVPLIIMLFSFLGLLPDSGLTN